MTGSCKRVLSREEDQLGSLVESGKEEKRENGKLNRKLLAVGNSSITLKFFIKGPQVINAGGMEELQSHH